MEIEIEMPSSRRQIKQASRDFTAYLIGEMKKGRGEVRERSLNSEELKQFAGAKMKEVNQYIEHEVLETLPPKYEVPKERILKMRWVMTWKDDPTAPEGRKAKGRIVILGYQDPDLTERPRSAPTATRSARMVFPDSGCLPQDDSLESRREDGLPAGKGD